MVPPQLLSMRVRGAARDNTAVSAWLGLDAALPAKSGVGRFCPPRSRPECYTEANDAAEKSRKLHSGSSRQKSREKRIILQKSVNDDTG